MKQQSVHTQTDAGTRGEKTVAHGLRTAHSLAHTSNRPSGANRLDVLDDGWRSQRMYILCYSSGSGQSMIHTIKPKNMNLSATASAELVQIIMQIQRQTH